MSFLLFQWATKKCQPEHFTLTDKKSRAVIFTVVVLPRDACIKWEVDLFYFYFFGFRKTNRIRAVEYEVIHLCLLHLEWKLEATVLFCFCFVFFSFLECNNKKWVIIIGHEQQFIIGSSQWLGTKKNGEMCIVHAFHSAVHLTTQPCTEPVYILNIN